MKTLVVFELSEWKSFQIELAKTLTQHSQQPHGFQIIDRESGEEITDRLEDWMLGVLGHIIDHTLDKMNGPKDK